MTTFLLSPTNIELFGNGLIRDPITGFWVLPAMEYNINIRNPFFNDIEPLHDDKNYQNRVIDSFLLKLTERWLYRKPIFRKLLKYFNLHKEGDKGTVSLVKTLDSLKEHALSEEDRKYIFMYIEKYFITRKFVRKVLKEYIDITHIKWYDLFNNTPTIVDLLAHKLKKLIISTIYETQDVKPAKANQS